MSTSVPPLQHIPNDNSDDEDDTALFEKAAAEVRHRYNELQNTTQHAPPVAVAQATSTTSTSSIMSLDDLFAAPSANVAPVVQQPRATSASATNGVAIQESAAANANSPSSTTYDYFAATSNQPDAPLLPSSPVMTAPPQFGNNFLPNRALPETATPMQRELWRRQAIAQQQYQQAMQMHRGAAQPRTNRIDAAFGRRR